MLQELRRIAVQCERKEFQRFPVLRSKLYEVVNQFFSELQQPTLEMIRGLINLELAYINTKHPEFVGGETAVRQNLQADGAQGIACLFPVWSSTWRVPRSDADSNMLCSFL